MLGPAARSRWFVQQFGPRITTYQCPATGSTAQVRPVDLSSDFFQDGPVWNYTPFELKSIMREGHADDFGFSAEELARRACYEFETHLSVKVF